MLTARNLYLLAGMLVLFWGCSEPSKSSEENGAWFPFSPDADLSAPSEIDLGAWLDAPAGKYGFVQMDGDRLVFENGQPVKFWGTNICSRHNYFGGGAGGHRLDTGAVKNKSMLSRPGSGLLSTGMQQVADRPFSFSEWMSLIPNEWTAESDPLIAACGMGLQGWDASFSFAVDHPRYSPYLQSESHGVYNVTSPLHLGLYPALAPMIYRGDVAESPLLATRNVHIPSLAAGKLGFVELVTQAYDVKSFTGTIPSEALAIGRFSVKFTDTYQPTDLSDLSAHWDTVNRVITSATEQLQWHYGEKDYVTINTAGTKGVIGFIPGKDIVLDDWTITTNTPFAIVLATSLDRRKALHEANRILITTVARAHNTGMTYNEAGDTLLTAGDAPLLLEAVDATIQLPDRGAFDLEVLDHNGRSTGQFVEHDKTRLHLDGARYRTIYYLLRY